MKWSIKNVTVGTVEKSNRKIVEIGQIDTPTTQIHDRSLYWHGTRTSIKSGMVISKFIGPDLHFLWNDSLMHVNKYQPSLIPEKQHYYKERYNLGHYLRNTEAIKCTCVIHFCISSLKDRRWPQPLFKYYIVFKATVRHNIQTIVTFKGVPYTTGR
jgi:hypothetical protein